MKHSNRHSDWRSAWRLGALAVLPLCALACIPSFQQPASLVEEPRVLAVRGTPAESRPGESVTWDALLINSTGTIVNPAIDWTLCLTPKPLDENNVVASACLGDAKNSVAPLGAGATMTTSIPLNACALFGPDPPPQMMGQPPLRPRDPDVSGGYYQPVRVQERVDRLVGFGLQRITCDLASAGVDIAVQFAKEYLPNQNPKLIDLTASVGGQPLDLANGATVPAGAAVTFSSGWSADSPEPFPVYDVVSQTLAHHREAMRISWFASAGAFDHEVTGRGESDLALTVDNRWIAPSPPNGKPLVVHVWLVLRDSRGGSDFKASSIDLIVMP